MAGVAVEQAAISKVEQSAECGNEHRRIGLLIQTGVHRRQQPCRVVLKDSVCAKKRFGHGHDKRRSDAFASDIADAELQAVVVPEKVVEITADLPCRTNEGVNGKRRLLGQHDRSAREHAHLNLAGKPQRLLVALMVEIGERAHERVVAFLEILSRLVGDDCQELFSARFVADRLR